MFLLKQKSDESIVFPNFHKLVKIQFGVGIKEFMFDNAKDYFNRILPPYFQKEGIIHESSCVSILQQNGVAEEKMVIFWLLQELFCSKKMFLNHIRMKQYLLLLIL